MMENDSVQTSNHNNRQAPTFSQPKMAANDGQDKFEPTTTTMIMENSMSMVKGQQQPLNAAGGIVNQVNNLETEFTMPLKLNTSTLQR